MLQLLFHRVEANSSTFHLRRWLVPRLRATQVPHVAMASKTWYPRGLSHALSPSRSPGWDSVKRGGEKEGEKFCLVN